ncbi:MAG: zinc ABC transporter substrate-binding protein, partial [Planctomycetota bacterium]|nr:zinc ABC transporter substrate-binding protein [Planctomycetota bacterium]
MTCTVNSLRFIATVWIGSLFLALMSGCRGDSVSTESLPNETSKVITSNYPLWFFAERLGGDEIEVELLVPTSINPSFWRPDAEDVQEMQRAKLV